MEEEYLTYREVLTEELVLLEGKIDEKLSETIAIYCLATDSELNLLGWTILIEKKNEIYHTWHSSGYIHNVYSVEKIMRLSHTPGSVSRMRVETVGEGENAYKFLQY